MTIDGTITRIISAKRDATGDVYVVAELDDETEVSFVLRPERLAEIERWIDAECGRTTN